MALTQKRKLFLASLLEKDFVLTALDYDYAQDDENSFKAQHGLDFKQAQEALNELVKFLTK